jgi:hypothetical protein
MGDRRAMQRNCDAIEPEVMTHFIRLIFAPARVPYLASSIPDASNYEKQCMPTYRKTGGAEITILLCCGS